MYICKTNSEGTLPVGLSHKLADASSALLVLMVLFFNLGARGLGLLLQRRVTGT